MGKRTVTAGSEHHSRFVKGALALPGTVEGSHFGKRDFRVRGKIFASLPDAGRAVIKLSPEEQHMLTAAEPRIFAPVAGGWGRKGWTAVQLANCDPATLRSAVTMAWRNVAPAHLRKQV